MGRLGNRDLPGVDIGLRRFIVVSHPQAGGNDLSRVTLYCGIRVGIGINRVGVGRIRGSEIIGAVPVKIPLILDDMAARIRVERTGGIEFDLHAECPDDIIPGISYRRLDKQSRG